MAEETATSRRRAIEVRIAGLDRRVTAKQPSCEARTMNLWEPLVELAVAVVELFGGTRVGFGEVEERRAWTRWPKHVHRSVRISTQTVLHAVARLTYTHHNPMDGDGWNISMELHGIDSRPRLSAGSWCSASSLVYIAGEDLEAAQLDAIAAATAAAFGGPFEIVRRDP
jgi:hypothetical protein